jgi:hypothetical protein
MTGAVGGGRRSSGRSHVPPAWRSRTGARPSGGAVLRLRARRRGTRGDEGRDPVARAGAASRS